MVAQDDEAAAGAEQVDRSRKPGLEGVELFIDRDAQRLEDAGRRVDPAAKPWVRRRHPLDQGRKLLSRLHWADSPGIHDGTGDTWRLRFLAVSAEERRQLVCVERCQQFGRRDATGRIETHVERSTGPNPEATLTVGQLKTRQPKIEQAPVNQTESGVASGRRQLPEVRLAEDESVTVANRQPLPDPTDRGRVGVEPKESSIWVGGFQDPLGVPTAAQGGIDVKAAMGRGEHREDLFHQHRQVPFVHHSSIPDKSDPERILEAHMVGS